MAAILRRKPCAPITDAPVPGEDVYVPCEFGNHTLMRIFEHGMGYGAESATHVAQLVYDTTRGFWTAVSVQPKGQLIRVA